MELLSKFFSKSQRDITTHAVTCDMDGFTSGFHITKHFNDISIGFNIGIRNELRSTTPGYIRHNQPEMRLQEFYLWLPYFTVFAKAMDKYYWFSFTVDVVLYFLILKKKGSCFHDECYSWSVPKVRPVN